MQMIAMETCKQTRHPSGASALDNGHRRTPAGSPAIRQPLCATRSSSPPWVRVQHIHGEDLSQCDHSPFTAVCMGVMLEPPSADNRSTLCEDRVKACASE